jgi:HEAT repeat protein
VSAPVDWQALAERLGTITWRDGGGRSESGGTDVACRALIEVLGDEFVLDAVDCYLEQGPGSEAARSVLQLLAPPRAMERCMEIFRSSSDPETLRWAIILLRWVADRRALEWYEEIMAHEDDLVRAWGMRVIDQLYMRGVVEPEEAIILLEPARADGSDVVRSNAEQIVEMLEHDMALEQAREGASS